MSDVYSSPSDPTFWMHHLFVDHTYRVWQGADPSRLQTLNGNDAQGNPLTLDTIVSVNGIRPDVRVRDIINTGTTTRRSLSPRAEFVHLL